MSPHLATLLMRSVAEAGRRGFIACKQTHISAARPKPIPTVWGFPTWRRTSSDAAAETESRPEQGGFGSRVVFAPNPPTLYLLNARSIAKRGAVGQLAADLRRYSVDVAILSETHLDFRCDENQLAIDGFNLLRRDRACRAGGGVAVYASAQVLADRWTHPDDCSAFELLWVRASFGRQTTMIGAIYHPPRPRYRAVTLRDYLGTCLADIRAEFPSALIVLAGDFNRLREDELLVAEFDLDQIVRGPTRGWRTLDKIYVSQPCYPNVHIVTPSVSSDHRAVVAHNADRSWYSVSNRQPNVSGLTDD